jgi:hypothetical protein
MTAIVATTGSASAGPYQIVETTLTASDTLSYVANSNQSLKLRNPTGSSIVITIKGTAPVNPTVPGTGTTFDVSAGKVITVTAGNIFAVNLDKIAQYLGGTATAVAVTGGTGAFAALVS